MLNITNHQCVVCIVLQIGEFFGYSMDTVDLNGDL